MVHNSIRLALTALSLLVGCGDSENTAMDGVAGGGVTPVDITSYVACADDDCPPTMTCLMGEVDGETWSLCSAGACLTHGDCGDTDVACDDAPGDDDSAKYCAPTCGGFGVGCPDGMTCAETGENTSICVWPS